MKKKPWAFFSLSIISLLFPLSPMSSSSSSSSERILSTASVLDEALATAAPLSLELDDEVFLRTLPAAAERRSGATAADARPAGAAAAAARQETAALLREHMAVAFMISRVEEGEKEKERELNWQKLWSRELVFFPSTSTSRPRPLDLDLFLSLTLCIFLSQPAAPFSSYVFFSSDEPLSRTRATESRSGLGSLSLTQRKRFTLLLLSLSFFKS